MSKVWISLAASLIVWFEMFILIALDAGNFGLIFGTMITVFIITYTGMQLQIGE